MADSSTYRLVVVNTIHIQKYIFNSNRLRENIGASYLVSAVTGLWAWQALLAALALPEQPLPESWDHLPTLESGAAAEVIYAGGGTFVALLPNDDNLVRTFGRNLSSRVLTEAPGLPYFVHQQVYRWGDPLGPAVSSALNALTAARTQPTSQPLAGLGVTMMCRSTALPAVTTRSPSNDTVNALPISAEVNAKWTAAEAANQKLRNTFLADSDYYTFPTDLDDLGRTRGERSFIAIVHADANGLGLQVEQLAQIADPRTYIRSIRQFSRRVAAASERALKSALAHIIPDQQKRQLHIFHPLLADHGIDLLEDRVSGQIILPFRPIVFGGDDVTFVCDGRIGISLAIAYLRAFEAETSAAGHPGTAAAGIAIVKSHYPFARAYEMAEELTSSAKKLTRAQSALDWHFALSGLLTDLETTRTQQYRSHSGSLTLRPVTLKENTEHFRHWPLIEQALAGFYDSTWSAKRNKQKALHDALLKGPTAVANFLSTYRARLPQLDGVDFAVTGWSEGYCGYADALELLDLYIPLTLQHEGVSSE